MHVESQQGRHGLGAGGHLGAAGRGMKTWPPDSLLAGLLLPLPPEALGLTPCFGLCLGFPICPWALLALPLCERCLVPEAPSSGCQGLRGGLALASTLRCGSRAPLRPRRPGDKY